MAPEVFFGKKYSKSVDIWTLGVCLFEMLTFEKPFDYKDFLIKKQFVFKIPEYVNEFYAELLN